MHFRAQLHLSPHYGDVSSSEYGCRETHDTVLALGRSRWFESRSPVRANRVTEPRVRGAEEDEYRCASPDTLQLGLVIELRNITRYCGT